MRILLSCLQSHTRHSIAAYEFWRPYFVRGCEEAGVEYVEVPEIDWAEGLVHPPGPHLSEWRDRTWQTVLDFVRGEQKRRPVDVFLGYLYPCQIETQAVLELQRQGISCVNFFCDNVREFSRVPDAYKPFALHWVPEFEALAMYGKERLPHLHAPMPCWVPSEMRSVPEKETEPPTFIGSVDILRGELLGRALEEGADLVVRGPGWDGNPDDPVGRIRDSSSIPRMAMNQVSLFRSEGVRGLLCKLGNRLLPLRAPAISNSRIRAPVFGPDYFKVSREAQVTIGVNRVPTQRALDRNPLRYSRLRDIEAPMLGACYLTEWTAGLEHLYELGVEIESYRSVDELVFKIAELKADETRRRAMRGLGQRRALQEHSVARTLGRILKRLGR